MDSRPFLNCEILFQSLALFIFLFCLLFFIKWAIFLCCFAGEYFNFAFYSFYHAFRFMTGFVGLIYYVFAVPFGLYFLFFLHYELGVISFFSHLPFASFIFPNFPFFSPLYIYAYFIYRLFGRSIKKVFY